jgi:DNA anti-recombination protein RmuC
MTDDQVMGGEGSPAEVDRIRDIIFGPQMRRYEQQFQRVMAQLEGMGKQLDELRAAFDQQGNDQEAGLRKVQEDLRESIEGMRKDTSARMDQYEEHTSTQIRQLGADLRQQGQDFRSELQKTADALEDGKTGRHDLGDILVEMGTRLKDQAGIGDLLGQLGDLEQE